LRHNVAAIPEVNYTYRDNRFSSNDIKLALIKQVQVLCLPFDSSGSLADVHVGLSVAVDIIPAVTCRKNVTFRQNIFPNIARGEQPTRNIDSPNAKDNLTMKNYVWVFHCKAIIITISAIDVRCLFALY